MTTHDAPGDRALVPPAPGWYVDRDGVVRWWDGQGWTERVRPAEEAGEEAGEGAGAETAQQAGDQAAQQSVGGRAALALRTLVAVVVFVAVAGLTVLAVGLLGGDGEERGPADVVQANFAALREGDCAAFVATFSEADREVMGEAFCRQSDVFGDERLGELTVTSTDVDGDAARVTGTFTDGSGTQSFSFDLVREDGAWRIVQ